MAQIKIVDQPTDQPSRLLSLPVEIRLLIWKATMPSTPLLIYPTHKPFGEPLGPFRVNCVHPKPDYLQNSCFRRHNPPYRPGVVPVRPQTHPESWLLTNRQIYTEAYPLLTAARLRIHICRPLALVGYLACPPVASPQPQVVRSLTFCQSIGIIPVKEGYMLGDMDSDMWDVVPSRTGCAAAQLPELREIVVQVYFRCSGREVEEGSRGEEGLVMRCVDGEDQVDRLAEDMCKWRPLVDFVGRGVEVKVGFRREIVHSSWAWGPEKNVSECVCAGRKVDDKDAVRGLLEGAIGRMFQGGQLPKTLIDIPEYPTQRY